MSSKMQNHFFPSVAQIHLSEHTFVPLILWQMGFFRRRYREIIEAEKNRKDSDESWDWMEKNHWDLQWGGPRGANEIRDWVGKDPIARGLAAQLPHWHQALQSSICGREEYSPYFLETWYFLWVGGSRKQACEVTVGLARGHLLWNSANLKGGNSQPAERSCWWRPTFVRGCGCDINTGGQQNPQGCVT